MVDYRDKDKIRNPRTIPFKLPKNIEDKLVLLMKQLNLNTGSIDIIKTFDGRYVFLEVNPIGIYDEISINCNYYLNKKVAEWLTN